MTARQLRETLLSAVFPDRCAYCGQVVPHQNRICHNCVVALPVVEGVICPLCGCAKQDCTCGQHQKPYDRCIAPLYYEGMVRQGVLRMKERERPYIVRELAGRMIRAFLKSGEEMPDGVAYVPMRPKQERARGCNPSRLLAAEIADGLGLPVWPMLCKVQDTVPQKSLTAEERSGNVLGVFDWQADFSIKGRRILLIDDIVSTGATAGECAKVLKLYGAARVVLLVAAVNRKE